MQNFEIRKALKNDISSVIELQKEWQEESITYGFCMANEIDIENSLNDYYFVLVVNGIIEGYVSGNVRIANNMNIFSENEKYIEIDDLYIRKEHRNHDYGTQLVNTVIEASKNNGVERALIYSATKDMEKIIKFYKNCGFNSWYVQMYK